MNNTSIVKAINIALEHEMFADEDVILFGEDIGKNGGVFRATDGLQEKFGSHRVLDTPLAEALIGGLAVGIASYGLKPVAEFQFMGFIYPALEQIICHIARMRYRTNGSISCPVVIRVPYTGGINAPEHHSESTEAILAHIPGLRIITPSSPQYAYSLLRLAIQSPDPVVFLEPKKIYNTVVSEIDYSKNDILIDKCNILQNGNDLTIISWGAMLSKAQLAAKKAESELGISICLIDLVSIKPIDQETLLNSVSNTGRCIIVHEAAKTCGLAAEISSIITENIWHTLLAPVIRVTGFDTTMPAAKLEQFYLPSVNLIYKKIHKIMEY